MIDLFQENISTKIVETRTQVSVLGKAAAPTPDIPSISVAHVDKPEKFGCYNLKR